MKGTIRIVLGLLMVFGGVGGMEMSEETIPMDSFAVALTGLAIMAWGVVAVNKEEQA